MFSDQFNGPYVLVSTANPAIYDPQPSIRVVDHTWQDVYNIPPFASGYKYQLEHAYSYICIYGYGILRQGFQGIDQGMGTFQLVRKPCMNVCV